MTSLLHALAAATIAFACVTASRAAEPPVSVLDLFDRIPELPATAEEATRWIDRRGELVHPGLLALLADLKAHEQAMAGIQAVTAERQRAQSAVAVEGLGQGLADIGIDMARLQRDPAYAQQVQERMRSLSPQEMAALSQRMSQPMNQDARYQNAAQAMVDDPPAVQAAATQGEAYGQAQMARRQAHQAIWSAAEDAARRVREQPLALTLKRPAMAWDNIGCDSACQARWEAYANQAWPLMVARDTEILRIHRAAVQRQRAAVAEGLALADRHLRAAAHGASSGSEVNRIRIAAYDAAAVGEVRAIVERIVESLRSAAVVVNCGKQIVLVPGAVCP